jgi:hypothetical protein
VLRHRVSYYTGGGFIKKSSYEVGNAVIFSLFSMTKFFFSSEKSAPQNVI